MKTFLQNFIKYHSLGNDLIILDWYQKRFPKKLLSQDRWNRFVKNICDRHTGVGADGLLVVIYNYKEAMTEMLIFNADGSHAQNCLNGLRCVAHYLFTQKHFPKQFKIKTGSRINKCFIRKATLSLRKKLPSEFFNENSDPYIITSYVGFSQFVAQHHLKTKVKTFLGCEVHVGNPHFIIFEKATLKWLQNYGQLLESHAQFPEHINVEFVWKKKTKNLGGIKKIYNLMVYERGSGITLSCSSGAAAITGLLFQQKAIKKNEKIAFSMLGGTLLAWCDAKGEIVLESTARLLFSGKYYLGNNFLLKKPC